MGGATESRSAQAQAIASTAPVAPSMWPVIDLVDETRAACAAASPSARLMPMVSVLSLSLVEVPWALM